MMQSIELSLNDFKIVIKLVFSLICLIFSSMALAEEPCGNRQQELNECFQRGMGVADAELNKLYKIQMDFLQENELKDKLKAVQRAWVKFRDAACSYEVTTEGGSMYSMDMSICITKYTNQRIKDLQKYIECRDGGCPGGG